MLFYVLYFENVQIVVLAMSEEMLYFFAIFASAYVMKIFLAVEFVGSSVRALTEIVIGIL
jgi:hypothetical protein